MLFRYDCGCIGLEPTEVRPPGEKSSTSWGTVLVLYDCGHDDDLGRASGMGLKWRNLRTPEDRDHLSDEAVEEIIKDYKCLKRLAHLGSEFKHLVSLAKAGE